MVEGSADKKPVALRADQPAVNSFFRVKPPVAFSGEGEFCLSLVDPKFAPGKFEEIAEVREMLELNSQRESSGAMLIDPGLIFAIDCRLAFPIFVIGDGVFTRGEMLAKYPFEMFRLSPEKVLSQQEIGELTLPSGEVTYLNRDVGSDEPFEMPSFRTKRPEKASVRVAQSQIFLAGEAWDDFLHLAKSVRAAGRLRAAGGALPAPPKRDAPLALEGDDARARATADLLDSLGLGE
ncbi:MAG: hypothetical protein P1U53_15225 [Sulfitobacter sp.]|nr:hypothetical protein [Sulfitobacter sp.]